MTESGDSGRPTEPTVGHTWRAPTATRPVDAIVDVPGSKSMTNRALPLAALAGEPTVLRGALRSRDTDLMVAGLRALGVRIDYDNDAIDGAGTNESWTVSPPRQLRGPADIDCGLAGTVMRFLLAVSTLADGEVRFDGDPPARTRPLEPLLDALRALGARIDDSEGHRGTLPVTVLGAGHLVGGACSIDASASSQFVSALLLASARADGETVINHVGANLPSLPHIDMTVQMLHDRGVPVDNTVANRWHVTPAAVSGGVTEIEPDLSNAAPFAAAALVTHGTVRIARWPQRTTQPGAELPRLLTEMGAHCRVDEAGLVVRGGGVIHGIDVDLRDTSELMPTLAALAALADSPSKFHGIGHMRGHETDRLAALARELSALGADVVESADSLAIRPKPLHGGIFHTYADHRLATSAAVLGLAVASVEVENVETTSKTLPGFVDMWGALLR